MIRMTNTNDLKDLFASAAAELSADEISFLDGIVKEMVTMERDYNTPGAERSADERVNKLLEFISKVEIK
jgi:hypothetical protein